MILRFRSRNSHAKDYESQRYVDKGSYEGGCVNEGEPEMGKQGGIICFIEYIILVWTSECEVLRLLARVSEFSDVLDQICALSKYSKRLQNVYFVRKLN